MRKRISKKKSNAIFKRTAMKTHKKNITRTTSRGGIRM